jgi:hypothetical protein
MLRQGTRAWALLAVAAIAGVTAAVGAYAYFTNSGSGSGTATVGTSSGITLSGSPAQLLYPGGADRSVTVTITNPGSGAQYVGTVSGTVADNGGCDGDWFEVDPVLVGATLAPGASTTRSTVVRMLDSGTNQDACKNASMTITWSST